MCYMGPNTSWNQTLSYYWMWTRMNTGNDSGSRVRDRSERWQFWNLKDETKESGLEEMFHSWYVWSHLKVTLVEWQWGIETSSFMVAVDFDEPMLLWLLWQNDARKSPTSNVAPSLHGDETHILLCFFEQNPWGKAPSPPKHKTYMHMQTVNSPSVT